MNSTSNSQPGLPTIATPVLIIGTGFSGLCVAIELKREGKHDFIILERAGDVGGTWRENTYPGAACDVHSHLYSFSFRPNPRWSKAYAPQPEILQYLQQTARDEKLLPHIRFGENVERASWDETRRVWRVETLAAVYEAKALICAAGHLSDPSYPKFPGLEKFKGRLFHSAQWDHSAQWQGRRVGVVGTGASGIQIVPELAREASHLTVFQRSAPYIVPRRDHPYTEAEKRMFERFPELMQELRDELFWGGEARFPQRRQVPAFIEMIRKTALDHLHAQVTDEALLKKLLPHYAVGCKRILISNDYYPTFSRENVSLETDPIERLDETGIILKSGKKIELDVLVVATGFEATEPPIARLIRGASGETLAERWKDGGAAFECATISDFPNLFFMLGPNTGLGAGSQIYMIETQAKYIREGVSYVVENQLVAEPDRTAESQFGERVQNRVEGTVWVSEGCSSWYLHPTNGKLTALWPDFMFQFRKENGTFRPDGYQFR